LKIPSSPDPIEQALIAHSIANTNVLLALITFMVDKGLLGRTELDRISAAFSKPLDLAQLRENPVVRSMQDRFESDLAHLVNDIQTRDQGNESTEG
jgi:hypothetical protein